MFPKPLGPDVIANRPVASWRLQLVIYMATDAAWSICIDNAWHDFAGGGGGGITEITSTDTSVTVTNPTGPTTDLSVPPPTLTFADLREESYSGGQSVDPTGTVLTWAHSTGDTLLDYTDPTLPTVIDAGLYTFAFTIGTDQLAGIFGAGFFFLDWSGTLTIGADTSAPLDGDATSGSAFIGMSMTAYLAAGAQARVLMRHTDAVNISAGLDVIIQKILAG